jgi:hypothetical protein
LTKLSFTFCNNPGAMPRIQAFKFFSGTETTTEHPFFKLLPQEKSAEDIPGDLSDRATHELNSHDGVASHETLQPKTHDAVHTSAMMLNNPRLSFTRL